MAWLAILLYIGAIVTALLIFFGMLGSDAMPWRCPRCQIGGDDDATGRTRRWYVRYGDRVCCRTCRTWFKEHPNGSLVEDRD
jgi:hypothetical protein